jgi:hypothetical protein
MSRRRPTICFLLGLTLTIVSPLDFAQSQSNSPATGKTSNPYFDKFVFLPGGSRSLAAAMSATNETFRSVLHYMGEVHAANRLIKLPPGITQSDVSNVQYILFTWPQTVQPRQINFYGKVVDESNQPVAGATAHFAWHGTVTNENVVEFIASSRESTTNVDTDSEGLFSLTNKIGTKLQVSVDKSGYYTSRHNPAYFEYSTMNLNVANGVDNSFKPDSNHPIVFALRKIGVGANELITSERGVRDGFWANIPRNGTSVNVDLLAQKVGSGSLEIKTKKPDYPAHGAAFQFLSPSDQAKVLAATNWSISMKFNDGGFIEEDEEFPFNPPETGYQPVVTFNFQKGQTNWVYDFKKDFYIKFGNPPVYGQLNVETMSDGGYVIFTYVINPDGSRNLEPKPQYFPSSSRWTH